MVICIKVNTDKETALSCAKKILALFLDKGTQIVMNSECKKYFSNEFVGIKFYDTDDELFSISDKVITVGGDGTIIHAAKHSAKFNIPLIGVNVGRLGFAAELEINEIDQLKRLLTNDYEIEKRMLLNVAVIKDSKVHNFLAVNDAVISRGRLSRIIDMNVYLNDENIQHYRADGLIFSTPTGSTAYSLSAGGPVIEPTMKSILLTPICPHSLADRCVLFSDTSKISVLTDSYQESESYLTIDGQHSVEITANDKVVITKAKEYLTLIKLKGNNFYNVLNSKLKGREE